MCTTSPPLASAPKFQIRYAHPISPDCHQPYIAIVANGCGYTQGPFWLPWGIALVGQGNQIGDIRFLFSPFLPMSLLWPPKHKYNAVSAIADGIWQYRTGGNLAIFDKNHDTAEIAKVLAVKHTASLQLLCAVGGGQARLDARTELEILEPSPKGGWKLVVHTNLA